MTSVGRQFKTSQGSERVKKKRPGAQPASSIAETYKASPQISTRDLECKPAKQAEDISKFINPFPRLGNEVSVLFRVRFPEHLHKEHTPFPQTCLSSLKKKKKIIFSKSGTEN